MVEQNLDSDSPFVSVIFTRKDPEKGRTGLRFENQRDKAGIECTDMKLYLDLYPLNPSGKRTTLEDVKALLKNNSVDFKLVDFSAIEQALRRIGAE